MLFRCYHGSVFVVIKNKLTFSDSCKLTPVMSVRFISALSDVVITPLTTHRTVLVALISLIKWLFTSSFLNAIKNE
jgi:hypothetical protein